MQDTPRAVVVEGGSVLTMADSVVRPSQDVHVVGGVITAVVPTGTRPRPPDALVVPAHGRFVIPGLMDSHVHLRHPGELVSYLRHGVTSVLQMSGTTGPMEDLTTIQAEIDLGSRIGPRIYATGPLVDGVPANAPDVSVILTDPGDVPSFIERHRAAGHRLIKVHNNVSPEVFAALIDGAERDSLTLVGHVPTAVPLPDAYSSGLRMIAHAQLLYYGALLDPTCPVRDGFWSCVDRIDPTPASIPGIVERVSGAGIWVTPNLSFVEASLRLYFEPAEILADPETSFLAPAVLFMWRGAVAAAASDAGVRRRDLERQRPWLRQLTRAFAEADVPLLVGTDAALPGLAPGASTHLELRALVEAGLSPVQALHAATVAPAEFIRLHADEEAAFGTIARGSTADLVVLRGNPVEDIENAADIVGVMARGTWYSSAHLDSLRSAAFQP